MLTKDRQERHRIDVDCRRTDRTQPLFSTTQSSELPIDNEMERHRQYSSISPNVGEIGAQAPSNDHIERLAGILLTYHFYEKELGA
jgi:TBC1 domain family member 15